MQPWIRIVVANLVLAHAPAWAQLAPDDPLRPATFLVGNWSGEGKHPYGPYKETQTGRRELGDSVITIRTRSAMGEQVVHEDLRVISWDPAAKTLRMRQWAKGVLRIYTGKPADGRRLVFTETAREGESGDRWRYTFTSLQGGGFDYVVDVDAGKGWKPFVSGSLRAEFKDPSQAGGLALREFNATAAGMPAQIHHPDGKGPYPVIVFSPGGNANTFQGYRPYGRWWATWGYITVIVAFNDADAAERAPKFKSVTDWVLAENDRDGSPLKGLIDTKRLAVAGHSRGGNAALRAARADERIRACLALAPSGPDQAVQGKGTARACLIIGDQDEFLSAATKAYESAVGERFLLVVPGMTHMLAPREATLKLVARSTSFLNYALKGDARYRKPLAATDDGVMVKEAGK